MGPYGLAGSGVVIQNPPEFRNIRDSGLGTPTVGNGGLATSRPPQRCLLASALSPPLSLRRRWSCQGGARTLLLLTESGFDAIPAARRDEAFRMNDGGWTEQMKNIETYVTKNR